MAATQFLKARVTEEEKRRVQVIARQALTSESVWLRRLIADALRDSCDEEIAIARIRSAAEVRAPRHRVYVRLRRGDRDRLRDRAAAYQMASATYVSVLVRAHLNRLTPLPKDELITLKRSVAELGALGRNLNQIARAANGGRVVGPTREDLHAILRVCEALRDNVKGVIRANVNAWEIGHAEGQR